MLLLPDINDNKDKFYLDDPSLEKGTIQFDQASFSYFDKKFEERVDKKIEEVIGLIEAKKKKVEDKTEEGKCFSNYKNLHKNILQF